MKDKFFLDTNILIYSFDKGAKTKQSTAKKLILSALENKNGVISYQVVQEFINVSQRKFRVPIKTKDLKLYLQTVLAPLCETHSSIELYESALDIQKGHHFGFYDSLVVASALSVQCRILYSEDMTHGQKIHDLTIINPFK
jgi:predicted nucleic acid-binding protein